MKRSPILVVLALALTLSLPAVAAASPPNPCRAEVYRPVDAGPICVTPKPSRSAGPRSRAPKWEGPVAPPAARVIPPR